VDLTTYVVDDDEAARQSLIFLLRAESIRARAFPSAAALLEQLSPDSQGCIITDLRMPGMDGLALVRRLVQIGCRIPVIVITGYADVPLAVEAMKAGAIDFIEKPFESGVILHAVRRCLEVSEDQELKLSQQSLIERRRQTLTEREIQVYAAIVDGLSNKEVGLALNISPRTVEIHRANVMAKMQAQSLSELVRMALTSRAA
jgi:two-component system response regulator FixJ